MLINSSLGLDFGYTDSADSLNIWILANKEVLVDDDMNYLTDDNGIYLYE